MKITSRFVFGVIVITIGILLLVEASGIFPPISESLWSLIWKFWPLILIFLGSKLLIQKSNIPGMILLLLGVAFLSESLFRWNFFEVFWPIAIIALGLLVLFRDEKKEIKGKKNISSKDYASDTVVFWGLDRKVTSNDYKGGEYNVAFGGLGLDLREAKISKTGAKVHINCAFGGVEIFVPKDCRVKTNGTGIFGGWSPKISKRDVSDPVLEITGGVIFGGVDIK